MTDAATSVESHLASLFPGIRFGRDNCRLISGAVVWSQHAYRNARDLKGPTSLVFAEQQEFLDEVADYLQEHRTTLGIRTLLWRIPDHFDHIHIDFWPRGVDIPGCAEQPPTAVSWYQYADGSKVYTADPPWAGQLPEEEELMPRQLFEGMIRALFFPGSEFQGDPEFWVDLIDTPDDPQWNNDFWPAFTRTIS